MMPMGDTPCHADNVGLELPRGEVGEFWRRSFLFRVCKA